MTTIVPEFPSHPQVDNVYSSFNFIELRQAYRERLQKVKTRDVREQRAERPPQIILNEGHQIEIIFTYHLKSNDKVRWGRGVVPVVDFFRPLGGGSGNSGASFPPLMEATELCGFDERESSSEEQGDGKLVAMA
ncbi:hypothetical protein ACMD2_14532 [Ananas comosus]|uniref:Uncharacterized protein n=1 Tax=Ananas comosus TaxID=4615 RepID=A0A199VZP5_ANACO|nr:hypothetical protein ACMD2_14532 [Ananas comosus]